MKAFFYLLILFLVVSCSSPQKSLENGNYAKAYKSALNNLRKKNPDKANKEVLMIALREIIKRERIYVESAKVSGSVKRQIESLNVIDELKEKINRAEPYMNDEFLEDYFKLQEDEELLISDISEYYISAGLEHLEEYHQTKRKIEARKAFENFQRSDKFTRLTYELDSMMENSLELAQVIYSIEISTLWNMSHAWKIEQELSDLANNNQQFRKVYTGTSPSNLDIDCRIEISFSRLDIDTKEREDREDFERNITTTETTTNADGEEIQVETTTTVKATVITEQITKTAKWDVDISVRGTNNCDVRGTRFTEEVVSSIETKRVEGDEQALPSRYNASNNASLMSDDNMIDQLLDKINYQINRCLF